MACLPTLGGNVRSTKEAVIRAWARKPTRSADLHWREGCRLDPVWNLQDYPPVHHAGCQKGIGWPVKTGLTARVATHHRCASSGSRGRSKRHSRLAGPCKYGVHQSLRRNYYPYQAGRFGKVFSAERRRREDSSETGLAD